MAHKILSVTESCDSYVLLPVNGSFRPLCSQFIGVFGTASMSFPSSLPIHLLNFTFSLINNSVKLQWQTVHEINNSYFSIEKSADGFNFLSIGKVNAAGTSNNIRSYSYIDINPQTVNYYRLKETDRDGKSTYSNVLFVKFSSLQSFTILQNPVQNTLQFQSNQSGYYSIYDFSERRIKTGAVQIGNQSINVASFPSGTYVLQMITKDGQVFKQEFMKGK